MKGSNCFFGEYGNALIHTYYRNLKAPSRRCYIFWKLLISPNSLSLVGKKKEKVKQTNKEKKTLKLLPPLPLLAKNIK